MIRSFLTFQKQIERFLTRAASPGVVGDWSVLSYSVIEACVSGSKTTRSISSKELTAHDLRLVHYAYNSLIVITLSCDGSGTVGSVEVVIHWISWVSCASNSVNSVDIINVSVEVIIDAVGSFVVAIFVKANLTRIDPHVIDQVWMVVVNTSVDNCDDNVSTSMNIPRCRCVYYLHTI
jgi:hypothetical protein